MSDHKNIIARVEGHAGVIELDRPKALNSLTPDMIAGITQAVSKWENDDSIEVVIIRSTAKRAFCAGALTAARNDHRSRRKPRAEAEDADRVLTKRDTILANALP